MPKLSPIVAALPARVPFVAPEEIERRLGQSFLLRLGANESAFGPSPHAREAAAAFNPAHYGDPKSTLLREALARRHEVEIENIVVASGIDELLSLFCRAFGPADEAAVTTDGSYPTFEYAARGAGLQIWAVPYSNDKPDLEALAKNARRSVVVYLANPDNPTGALLSKEDIEAFRKLLPDHCLHLLDEAYADFVAPKDLPQFSVHDPGVVRFRTFSKAHGLAGLRIGYAIGHQDTVGTLDKIRLHFGVDGPAQAAALASLEDETHLAKVIRQTVEGRERLAGIGRSIGWQPLPSSTNFVLFDVGGLERSRAIVERLAERRVFVRSSKNGGVRITVGRREDLDQLEPILRSLD